MYFLLYNFGSIKVAFGAKFSTKKKQPISGKLSIGNKTMVHLSTLTTQLNAALKKRQPANIRTLFKHTSKKYFFLLKVSLSYIGLFCN
ncbi:hypothetical protein THALO_250208 [Tenacibaculum halocynthiae]